MSKQLSPTRAPIVLGLDVDNTLVMTQLCDNLYKRFSPEIMEIWAVSPSDTRVAHLNKEIRTDTNFMEISAMLETYKRRINKLKRLAQLNNTPLVVIFPSARPRLDFVIKYAVKFLALDKLVDQQGQNAEKIASPQRKTLSAYPRCEHQFFIPNNTEENDVSPEVKRKVIMTTDEEQQGEEIPLVEKSDHAKKFMPAIQLFNPVPELEDPDDQRFIERKAAWSAGTEGQYSKGQIFLKIKDFFAPLYDMKGRMILLDDQKDTVKEVRATTQNQTHCICVEELKQPSLSYEERLTIVSKKLDQTEVIVINILLADLTKQIQELYSPDSYQVGQALSSYADINKSLNTILQIIIIHLSSPGFLDNQSLTLYIQLRDKLVALSLDTLHDHPEKTDLALQFIAELQSCILATYDHGKADEYTFHRKALKQISFVMIDRLINNASCQIKSLLSGTQVKKQVLDLSLLKDLNTSYDSLYRILTKLEKPDIPTPEKTVLYREFRNNCKKIDNLILQAQSNSKTINPSVHQAIIQLQKINHAIKKHIRPESFYQLDTLLSFIGADIDEKGNDTGFTAVLQKRDPASPNFDEKPNTHQQSKVIETVQSRVKFDDSDSKKTAVAQVEFLALTQLVTDAYNEIKWEEDASSAPISTAMLETALSSEQDGLSIEAKIHTVFKFLIQMIEDFHFLQQKKSTIAPSVYEKCSDKIYLFFRKLLMIVERLQVGISAEPPHQQTVLKLITICGIVRNYIRPESFKQVDRLCHEKFAISPSPLSLVSQPTVATTPKIQINGRSVSSASINKTQAQRNDFVAQADPTSHQFYNLPPATRHVKIAKLQKLRVSSTTFSTQLTVLRKEIYPRQHSLLDTLKRMFEKIVNAIFGIKENPKNYNETRLFPSLRKTDTQRLIDRTLAPVTLSAPTPVPAPTLLRLGSTSD